MGREFDNSSFHKFATDNGFVFRFSCPQTSSQNGKAERMLRRLNEIVLSLLCHASLPPSLWVEALHVATYLHNILPTVILNFRTPSSVLYLKTPSYDHLCVFGCLYFPNLSANRQHKLQTRSTRYVFIGYPPNHRGYRCLDLKTGKVIISCHVTFDETVFPFASFTPRTLSAYSFLDPDTASLSPLVYPHIAVPTTNPPSQHTPDPSPPASPPPHNQP